MQSNYSPAPEPTTPDLWPIPRTAKFWTKGGCLNAQIWLTMADTGKRKGDEMRRIQIDPKVRRHRDDRTPTLPLDPRDPDVLRAKRATDTTFKDRSRA